ncbi:MAG: 50S ribosomal protein L25 [Phycisphaeraceae bacterium]|nr:50S ribosomal protein L25 [Phycisphaeraceae bacterium]
MATTQEIPELTAAVRKTVGSREAGRLRNEGRIPAVVYGHGADPLHISIDPLELVHLLHEQAHLLQLEVDGDEVPCLIKDTQWDYLGRDLLHADFTRVDLNAKVTVDVDLEVINESDAPGLEEEGAILHQERASIEITCLATNIPGSIPVDITGLEVGESVSVADLEMPEGVETTFEPDEAIVSITVVQEEPEEEELPAAGEEPEVIGAAEDEEGEEGEAPAEGAGEEAPAEEPAPE